MAKRRFHFHRQNKKWYKPYLNNTPTKNYAIRYAIQKWEREHGRKFPCALSDDYQNGLSD